MSNNEGSVELSGVVEKPEADAGPLSPAKQLAAAHRVWATCFNEAGMGSLAETMSQAARLEYLARAELTDAIALVCDGARCGLAEHAVSLLRTLDDVSAAQAVHDLRIRLDADRENAFPMGLQARHGHAVRVLSLLPDLQETAKEIVNTLLQGQGKHGDADRLARMLALEALPGAIVNSAYEAAVALGG